MKQFEDSRHILGLSGGKDSAALAIYMKDKFPNLQIEYYFLDTRCELPEVYDFLDKLEVYLDSKIIRIGSELDFEDHMRLQVRGGSNEAYLPSPFSRWCTKVMKIEPLQRYIGTDSVISYIGIRADEKRDGYIVKKTNNIRPVYPFRDDGLVRDDIFSILRNTIGIPEYYKWRSRSGCYFCFYQRVDEWIGLYENHYDLFQRAKHFEKTDSSTGKQYTWNQGFSLEELEGRIVNGDIKRSNSACKKNVSWQDQIIEDYENDELDDKSCWLCSL